MKLFIMFIFISRKGLNAIVISINNKTNIIMDPTLKERIEAL